jgi:hypothetical protein
MPLLDHFHPPLSLRRHWHSFHHSWATYLSSQLNCCLPEDYFAEANVQFGIEIDVATFEEKPIQTGLSSWLPSEPLASLPFECVQDTVQISIFSQSGGPQLAGAIELVSPSNKDRRPASREAFVGKCASYLQAGIGLVIVDVVTDRHADLHQELLMRLGHPSEPISPRFAAAYRPVERGERTTLDLWHEPVSIGSTLPRIPLWLRGGLCLPVELEETYERTCVEQRVRGVSV